MHSLNTLLNTHLETPPQHLIFDYDGTLATLPIDWAALRPRYREELLRLGPPGTLEDGMRIDAMEKAALDHGALSWDQIYAFRRQHESRVRGRHRPHPDMCQWAETFADQGIPLILLSNNFHQTVADGLEQLGLDSLFQLVVGIDDVRHPKPATAGLDYIQQRLDLDPATTVMIGDSATTDGAFCTATGIRFLQV